MNPLTLEQILIANQQARAKEAVDHPLDQIRELRLQKQISDLAIELDQSTKIARIFQRSATDLQDALGLIGRLQDLAYKMERDVLLTDTLNQFKTQFSDLSRQITRTFAENIFSNREVFDFAGYSSDEAPALSTIVRRPMRLLDEMKKVYSRAIPGAVSTMERISAMVTDRLQELDDYDEDEPVPKYSQLADHLSAFYGRVHFEMGLVGRGLEELETSGQIEQLGHDAPRVDGGFEMAQQVDRVLDDVALSVALHHPADPAHLLTFL